jgi:hypothetical protein
MLWGPFLSVAAHQGKLDVDLLGWIKDLLDGLLGLGDWAVVALTGALILAVPVGLIVVYFLQRKRGSYDAAVD